MATRSTIAIARDNGTVAQVYCHWDGYLDNNGALLVNHYNTAEKVEELLSHGAISSLGPTVGEKHDFDCPFTFGTPEYELWKVEKDKMTTYYGRDRGETDVDAQVYADVETYEREAQFEEYNYLFIEGRWYYKSYDGMVRDVERQLIIERLKKVA